MKIIKRNLKHGVVRLIVESLDDLWYLSHLVEPGDIAKTKSERKIKLGSEGEKTKVVKKYVLLSIEVEKVSFENGTLKLNGKVVSGTEDVPNGSYHGFSIVEGTDLEITKKEWLSYQVDKLKESTEEGSKVLIVVHDREEASFGLLTRKGLQVLSNIKGNVAKKGFEGQESGNFYKEIAKVLIEYDKKYKVNIVVASPGFWKEYLLKELDSEFTKNIVQATCSVVGERGLNEVVKRPELKQVLEKDRNRKELEFIDELLSAISKDESCYGFDDSEEKTNLGAVKLLLVSENKLNECRENNTYQKLDSIMKNVEKMNGKVHLISSEESAKKLDSLGGIGGVLRWKV